MATNRKAVASLLCATAVLFAICGAQQKKLPPDYEKKREAITSFEAGVVPLFVLGDLNEDGAVDQEDLKLLRAHVGHPNSAGISCLAAADLDDNGSINAHDVAVFEQILSKGMVKAPALSSHARLGCGFKHFFLAALPLTVCVPVLHAQGPAQVIDASKMPESGPAIVGGSDCSGSAPPPGCT